MIDSTDEVPVFFACGDLVLAGVLTLPSTPNGVVVLIPFGSAYYSSAGPNRIRAHLARVLAADGYHAFRFDYPGVGESEGEYRPPDIARPYCEEVLAACEWLAAHGLTRVIIIANCFGAWSSLMAAASIPGLEAIALVNSPVRRGHRETRNSWQWWAPKLRRVTVAKLRDPRYRAHYRRVLRRRLPPMLRSGMRIAGRDRPPPTELGFGSAISQILDRGIPVLLLYGDDDFQADLVGELDDGLRTALQAAGPPSRLVMVPDRLAGFASLESQALLLSESGRWLNEVRSSGREAARAAMPR